MPPLNVTKASNQHHIRFMQSDTNNNQAEAIKKDLLFDEDEQISKEFRYFHVKKPILDKANVRYIYIDDTKFGLVWPNILTFAVLHCYYIYALGNLMINWRTIYNTWFFRELSFFFR